MTKEMAQCSPNVLIIHQPNITVTSISMTTKANKSRETDISKRFNKFYTGYFKKLARRLWLN
jgi:hypothetical protein